MVRPPEAAGGKGGNAEQAGGTKGEETRGTGGSGKGGQGTAKPETAKPGGEGCGGKPTMLDHPFKVAGYWNLEFSADPKGQSGGIPGGMGKIAPAWGQGLYLGQTVADIIRTVVTLGGPKAIMAGAKAALKARAKAVMNTGRKALATLSVKNLRSIAARASGRTNIWADNVFQWIGFDDMAQARFFNWMVGKGAWRRTIVESGPDRWFLYGRNNGAVTNPSGPIRHFLGFWPYRNSVITNNG